MSGVSGNMRDSISTTDVQGAADMRGTTDLQGAVDVHGTTDMQGAADMQGTSSVETTGIVIAGVGGQGTLLASRIIGGAAIAAGFDVKVSEVHGMSQRGGSVITYVRYGRKPVASPIVDPGGADAVVAFELLEAYRSVCYLKKGGLMVVNTQAIDPMPVITGAAVFPTNIVDKLRGYELSLEALDAAVLARQAGSALAVNMVLIGRLAGWLAGQSTAQSTQSSSHMSIAKEIWLQVIKDTVKPAFIAINTQAFTLGYDYYCKE